MYGMSFVWNFICLFVVAQYLETQNNCEKSPKGYGNHEGFENVNVSLVCLVDVFWSISMCGHN